MKQQKLQGNNDFHRECVRLGAYFKLKEARNAPWNFITQLIFSFDAHSLIVLYLETRLIEKMGERERENM